MPFACGWLVTTCAYGTCPLCLSLAPPKGPQAKPKQARGCSLHVARHTREPMPLRIGRFVWRRAGHIRGATLQPTQARGCPLWGAVHPDESMRRRFGRFVWRRVGLGSSGEVTSEGPSRGVGNTSPNFGRNGLGSGGNRAAFQDALLFGAGAARTCRRLVSPGYVPRVAPLKHVQYGGRPWPARRSFRPIWAQKGALKARISVGTSRIGFATKIGAGTTKYRPNPSPERPSQGEFPVDQTSGHGHGRSP